MVSNEALVFLAATTMSYVLLRVILHIAYKHHVFDYIDGRKVHRIAVPRLGGMAFAPTVATVMLGALALVSLHEDHRLLTADTYELLVCLAALFFIYVEGLADDLVGVNYKLKFICQFVCSAIVISSGVCLTNFAGLFGIGEVSLWVGIPFTWVLITFILNAQNLIDGIDGLCCGLAMFALLFFGLSFAAYGVVAYATLAFATLGAIFPFFFFNVFGRQERKRKIFMGDCGSQTLGLILGILAVRLCQEDAPAGGCLPPPLLTVFSLLIVPCLDALRVMLGRIRHHHGPFHPDKTHIHHKLLALGFSHRQAMTIILATAAAYAALNYVLFLLSVSLTLIIIADLLLWTAMHITITHIMHRRGCISYFEDLEKEYEGGRKDAADNGKA